MTTELSTAKARPRDDRQKAKMTKDFLPKVARRRWMAVPDRCAKGVLVYIQCACGFVWEFVCARFFYLCVGACP